MLVIKVEICCCFFGFFSGCEERRPELVGVLDVVDVTGRLGRREGPAQAQDEGGDEAAAEAAEGDGAPAVQAAHAQQAVRVGRVRDDVLAAQTAVQQPELRGGRARHRGERRRGGGHRRRLQLPRRQQHGRRGDRAQVSAHPNAGREPQHAHAGRALADPDAGREAAPDPDDGRAAVRRRAERDSASRAADPDSEGSSRIGRSQHAIPGQATRGRVCGFESGGFAVQRQERSCR